MNQDRVGRVCPQRAVRESSAHWDSRARPSLRHRVLEALFRRSPLGFGHALRTLWR